MALRGARLTAGDISTKDVQVLKSSGNAVKYGTIGGALVGIPAYISLGKKRPAPPTSFKVMAAVTASLCGTMLGFAVGSLAGVWKVKNDMPDHERKMRVFQEVAYDAQRAIAERRAGIPVGAVVTHVAGIPGQDSFWTPQTGKVTYDQLRQMERRGEKWSESVKKQWDEASQQVKDQWKDAADQAKDGWNHAKNQAQSAADIANSKWDDIKSQAQDEANQAQKKGEKLWDKWTK